MRHSFSNKGGSEQIDHLLLFCANPARGLTHSAENLVEFQLVVQLYFGDLHCAGHLSGEKPAQLFVREVLQHVRGVPGDLVWYDDHKTHVTLKGKLGHLEIKPTREEFREKEGKSTTLCF